MSKPSEFELKDFRQPVVTSLGIVLGFLLGFLGQWVTEETFALKSAGDHLVFLGTVLGALLLFVALFRMLSPLDDAKLALATYRFTLKLYVAGVAIPLVCMLVSAFI
jgi:hypothetical protein